MVDIMLCLSHIYDRGHHELLEIACFVKAVRVIDIAAYRQICRNFTYLTAAEICQMRDLTF